ncbi:hypothetical protein KIN20_013935 [Parelaphostrongylus tenuis]|uniref:Uncharacterized protein n=1 Tax=Parelaphostrongylus tenuis TaxID=148309 RepID=A0AAD5QP29_PARTN|nr:hypothetical protein KIN20_013935 [Parelaphostrongylus tenuis]
MSKISGVNSQFFLFGKRCDFYGTKVSRIEPLTYKFMITLKSPEERHIGTYGLEWNGQMERLSGFGMVITPPMVTHNSKAPTFNDGRWNYRTESIPMKWATSR